MIEYDLARISDALVVWTGYGQSAWPIRDPDRLVAEFGPAATDDLLPVLRELEREFYESDEAHTVAGLDQMGIAASERFSSLHPELSGEAVDALAWCYTFDWK
ncbi:MAG: hypothetical protein U0Q22_17540 [Acidimicrobiales bacterium]